jgi:hypothetical protein
MLLPVIHELFIEAVAMQGDDRERSARPETTSTMAAAMAAGGQCRTESRSRTGTRMQVTPNSRVLFTGACRQSGQGRRNMLWRISGQNSCSIFIGIESPICAVPLVRA